MADEAKRRGERRAPERAARRFYALERRHEKLLPLGKFVQRIGAYVALACGLIAFGLGVGTLGYHYYARLSWIDAFLNASMILTGMGPVDRLETAGAKIFASIYALFSGSIFLTVMGVIMAPVLHRLMHKFHVAEEDDEAKAPNRQR